MTQKNAGPENTCNGTNPINPATGNKYQAETDYAGAGALPLAFERHYNSIFPAQSSLGSNWSSSYSQRLTITPTKVTAQRADGRAHVFTSSSGGWISAPDVTASLQQVSDGGGWRYTTAGNETETYDADGRLLSISNLAGLDQSMTYDTDWRLTNVTDSFGRGLAFSYDVQNRLSTITDPAGGMYTYTYDADNNLSSVTYPDATIRTYLYEDPLFIHALTGILDENGDRFATWDYDNKGRAILSTHAGGAERVELTYNADGSTTLIDSLGASRTYNFALSQGVFRTTSIEGDACTSCTGQVAETVYDANGFVASRTDFNGNLTNFVHNERGLEISRTEAAGTSAERTITTEWHPVFRLPVLITETGKTTRFSYDDRGLMLSQTETDRQTGAARTTSFMYTAKGLLASADGPRTDVGDITMYAYDPQGNLNSVTNALGQVIAIPAYDAHGNPLTVADPNGTSIELSYGPRQRLITQAIVGELTVYGYDGVGSLTRTTLPDGAYLDYTYDALNRVTRVTSPPRTFEYDQGVNGIGRLAGMTDPAGSTAWTYDAQGRITQTAQTTDGVVRPLRYAYNTQGQLASVTYPSGAVIGYTYDAAGRIASIDRNGALLISNITYQPYGTVSGWTWGNGLAYTRSFDLDGRVTSFPLVPTVPRNLTYDPASRITAYTRANGAADQSFVYDNLSRLTRFTVGASSQSYAYDANGNRIRLTIGTNNYPYTYPTTSNRLSAVSGSVAENYTYTPTGALLNDGTRVYAYDGRDRLIRVTAGASVSEYSINALGQRAMKTGAGGTVIFVYDEAGHLVGEYNASGAPLKETVYLGDTPVAVVQANVIRYIYVDHLNTPRAITNTANATVWRWDNNPFGATLPNEDPDGDGTKFIYNLRFPGQYFDKETGLHYNYFRDYDPGAVRYIQSDPIGLLGGLNTYAYAGGNPVMNTDQTGLIRPVGVIVLGGVVGGTASFLGSIIADQSVGQALASVPGGFLGGATATTIALAAPTSVLGALGVVIGDVGITAGLNLIDAASALDNRNEEANCQ